MTIEEKLKALILERYKSVREFCQVVDMPNSTVDSIFRRGIANSSVANVIKICKVLNISADELAEGRITFNIRKNVTESVEISEILADTKERLAYGYDLTLDGDKVDRESIDSIINAMDIGVEMAIKHNKTHNKTEHINKKIH